MYVDESIPSNFNRIAEVHDNYIVLVTQSVLTSDHNYEAYYQYISPSTCVIHVTDYRIQHGDDVVIDYNYNNNQYYNFLDNGEVTYTLHTMELEDARSDFWSRADVFSIFGTCVIILCFILWLINAVTSLVEKGGVFHL